LKEAPLPPFVNDEILFHYKEEILGNVIILLDVENIHILQKLLFYIIVIP
jgi:hypothetical protein